MGIRFFCPNGHKLNVKAHLAGKTGFCPECGARVQIPYEDTRVSSKAERTAVPRESKPPSGESGASPGTSPVDKVPQTAPTHPVAATASPVPGSPAPSPSPENRPVNPMLADKSLIWYLQVPGGTQYGPVDSQVVAKWIDEKRIAPEMLVWREDWPQWEEAQKVFPEVGF